MSKKRKAPIIIRKAPPPPTRSAAPIIARPSRKAKSVRQREMDLAEAYKIVSQSPYGQMVIADLMLSGNVYHDIQGTDLFAVGVQEGQRRVALRVSKYLGLRAEHFPDEAWRTAEIADNMAGL